jgi:cell division transport system ATP-binding protein
MVRDMSEDFTKTITPFTDAPPIVDVVKATKVYMPDVVALSDVTLSVAPGEILFLTGISGSGKSTLLKLICGRETANKGTVEVAGYNMSHIKQAQLQALRQKIGIVFQDFKLLPKYTAFENIAMSMEVAYRSTRTIKNRTNALLDMLKLSSKKNAPVGKLSRGEQQRVAIARAAANSPPLLLADEPTGNLDRAMSKLVMELLKQLNEEGTTVIISSHDELLYRNTPYRKIDLCHGHLQKPSFTSVRSIMA